MKRFRRIKHTRKVKEELKYTDTEVVNLILAFLKDRLTPEKRGFGEIIYNNSIPILNEWFLKNKKK
jgi:hypothetical protein